MTQIREYGILPPVETGLPGTQKCETHRIRRADTEKLTPLLGLGERGKISESSAFPACFCDA